MLTKVIINEQHSLMEEQAQILQETFGEYEFLKVPAEGWNLEQMKEINASLSGNVVFCSPIPVLLGLVSAKAHETHTKVYVFHNDVREKKELPNSKIIQVVAATGWQLVQVA